MPLPPSVSSERRIQLIGMSATLPNLALLAGWLSAALYVSDFRPVPLRQYAKLAGTAFDERLKPVRQVDTSLSSGVRMEKNISLSSGFHSHKSLLT